MDKLIPTPKRHALETYTFRELLNRIYYKTLKLSTK